MPNLFYQGAELFMSSGNIQGIFAKVDRVQDVQIGAQPPRTNVGVLGRFSPLPQRPVINYTPVSLSFTYAKGNKDVERNFLLLNTTGVLVGIGNGTQITDYGARSFQVMLAPSNIGTYAGEYDVQTGILKSFSLQGSVTETVRGSVSVEALDLQQVANNSARVVPSYSGNLIKNENVTLTGIDFTGLGFSGIIFQSFSLGISINHANTFRIGTKYPERRVTDGVASLQLQGFIEGSTNTVGSLSTYDCGNYITGQYVMTLTPSCSTEPATTVTFTNPYFENLSIGAQVGNFVQVDLSFAVPLSNSATEITANAPNLIIT